MREHERYDPTDKNQYIVFRKEGEFLVHNVEHHVAHHSPDGFNCGYGGSGPADLALNILEDVLLQMKHSGPKTDCHDGRCFELAWDLHQQFKWQFVAGTTNAIIPVETIRDWIAEHTPLEKNQ